MLTSDWGLFMDWFRVWHGAATDNKWLAIARRAGVVPGIVSAVFVALLDCASQAEDRGNVGGFDLETYAAFSGFDESAIATVIAALHDKGVIGADNRLSAWDKRQPKRENDSDTAETAAERKRKSRAAAAELSQHVTACHSMSQHVTAPEKRREDTDQDQELQPQLPSSSSSPAPEAALTVAEENPEPLPAAPPPPRIPALPPAPAAPEVAAGYDAIRRLYEQNFGLLTPILSSLIKDSLDTYPADWIPAAMEVAVTNDHRSWGYVEGVLKKCLVKGLKPEVHNGRPDNRSRKNQKQATGTGGQPAVDPYAVAPETRILGQLINGEIDDAEYERLVSNLPGTGTGGSG